MTPPNKAQGTGGEKYSAEYWRCAARQWRNQKWMAGDAVAFCLEQADRCEEYAHQWERGFLYPESWGLYRGNP